MVCPSDCSDCAPSRRSCRSFLREKKLTESITGILWSIDERKRQSESFFPTCVCSYASYMAKNPRTGARFCLYAQAQESGASPDPTGPRLDPTFPTGYLLYCCFCISSFYILDGIGSICTRSAHKTSTACHFSLFITCSGCSATIPCSIRTEVV